MIQQQRHIPTHTNVFKWNVVVRSPLTYSTKRKIERCAQAICLFCLPLYSQAMWASIRSNLVPCIVLLRKQDRSWVQIKLCGTHRVFLAVRVRSSICEVVASLAITCRATNVIVSYVVVATLLLLAKVEKMSSQSIQSESLLPSRPCGCCGFSEELLLMFFRRSRAVVMFARSSLVSVIMPLFVYRLRLAPMVKAILVSLPSRMKLFYIQHLWGALFCWCYYFPKTSQLLQVKCSILSSLSSFG